MAWWNNPKLVQMARGRIGGGDPPASVRKALMEASMNRQRPDNTYVAPSNVAASAPPHERRPSILPPLGSSSVIGAAASQYLGNAVNRATRFIPWGRELVNMQVDEGTFSKKQRDLLYRAVDKKASESGKNHGVVGYEDIASFLPEEEASKLMDAVRGRMSSMDRALLAATNGAADIALSLGNFTYDRDPVSGKVKLYDEYDFINRSNVEKNQDGKQVLKKDWVGDKTRNSDENTKKFFSEHDKLTQYDLWAKENRDWNNRRANVNLSPSDTASTSRKLPLTAVLSLLK